MSSTPAIMSASGGLHEFGDDARPLRAELQFGAIICISCGNRYPLSAIDQHLKRTPHFVCKLLRVKWLKELESLTFAATWTDLKTPEDGTIPIEGVKVRPGYACKHCTFRTCSEYTIRCHMVATHPSMTVFERVYLQCWNRNNAEQYWIVNSIDRTNDGIGSEATGHQTQTGIIFIFIYRMQQMYCCR